MNCRAGESGVPSVALRLIRLKLRSVSLLSGGLWFHIDLLSCLGCNDAWSRASWSNIVEFIIEIGIAAFFLFLIFGYYKQLLDPSSPAYVPRNQAQYPLGPYPPPQFPPPQGPPPTRDDQSFAPPYDSAKLPAYDGTQQKYGDTKDGGQGLLKAEDDDPFGDFRNDVGRSGSGNARR